MQGIVDSNPSCHWAVLMVMLFAFAIKAGSIAIGSGFVINIENIHAK